MPEIAAPPVPAAFADREIDVGMADEPAPKKKSKLMLWLIIGGAVLLTLILGFLAVYFLVIRPAQQAASQLDQMLGPDLQQQLQQIQAQPGAVPQLGVPGIPSLPVNVPPVPTAPPAPAVPAVPAPPPAGQ
jgi:hypothetical protein